MSFEPTEKKEQLPDQLRNGLRLGTAAGRLSARTGAYYAHPGNRFWRTLFEIGLTSRKLEPHEYRDLLGLGIGFTDIAKMASGMDREIHRSEFDPALFAEKMRRFRPRAVAFTSKEAARRWLRQPSAKIELGRQADHKSGFAVFVLSSPSGAARGSWSIESWRELSEWLGTVV